MSGKEIHWVPLMKETVLWLSNVVAKQCFLQRIKKWKKILQEPEKVLHWVPLMKEAVLLTTRNRKASLIWLSGGKKKEKSFCKIGETMLHCCPLIQQGSSLNLLLSERQSQLLCSCLQLKVYQPDQTELNSTTESLILAQDERWRRA